MSIGFFERLDKCSKTTSVLKMTENKRFYDMWRESNNKFSDDIVTIELESSDDEPNCNNNNEERDLLAKISMMNEPTMKTS